MNEAVYFIFGYRGRKDLGRSLARPPLLGHVLQYKSAPSVTPVLGADWPSGVPGVFLVGQYGQRGKQKKRLLGAVVYASHLPQCFPYIMLCSE